MKVVLDTNVVVSAILWGGTPRKLFDLADAGQITLFTSIELLRELTGILSRDKFSERIWHRTSPSIRSLMATPPTPKLSDQ